LTDTYLGRYDWHRNKLLATAGNRFPAGRFRCEFGFCETGCDIDRKAGAVTPGVPRIAAALTRRVRKAGLSVKEAGGRVVDAARLGTVRTKGWGRVSCGLSRT